MDRHTSTVGFDSFVRQAEQTLVEAYLQYLDD
jgi:hypothetical protein